jgi:peptide deformylase
MSILKVARLGHPVLRAKAKPIDPKDITSAAIQKLIDDMMDTMEEYHGIGLAGPQVHEGLRLFVAGIEKKDRRTGEVEIIPTPIVNPDITPIGRDLVEDWEGCLSIPDIRGRVPRNRRVRVRGYDRDAAPLDVELEDFPARVVQHEFDHLNGVLFFDRMKSFESLTFLDEYSRFWSKDSDDD